MALAVINSFDLTDLTFRYVADDDHGIVALKLGEDERDLWDGGVIWARAEFPRPRASRYKVRVYKAAFEPKWRNSLRNILMHEFAHLLGMRHWDAGWREVHLPSIEYPIGEEPDPRSIMGSFRHPGELFFHERDVEWLKNLYALAQDHEIGGLAVKDARPRPRPRQARGTNVCDEWAHLIWILYTHLQSYE